jgi:hypothetical protein
MFPTAVMREGNLQRLTRLAVIGAEEVILPARDPEMALVTRAGLPF